MGLSTAGRRISITVIVALVLAAGLFFVVHREPTLYCKGVGISPPVPGPEPAGLPTPEAAGMSAARVGPMWPPSLRVPADGWTFDGGRAIHDLPGGQTFRVDVRQTNTGGWIAAGNEDTCRT